MKTPAIAPILPPRRIVVTGGAGFLGSHLCTRLVEAGHEVLCVDNFYTGSKANIAHLMGRPNFELLRHDITFPLHVQADEIYNLACPASPVHYQHNPVETTKTCVHGSINMLELARHLNARILQASTSEVYGDPSMHPQREDYWGHVNPNGIRACYDEGKRCAETLFADYRRQYGLQVKIARIFNTYGPHMRPDDGRVVSNFAMQALAGEPLTVYGDGSQTRSFCYVADLIDGLIRLMNSPDDFTGPVNLGNTQEATMLEIASKVLALSGRPGRIAHRPLPQDDPVRRCPDIALAERMLGWRPRTALDAGLARTVGYFSRRYFGRRLDAAGPSDRPGDRAAQAWQAVSG